MKAKRTVQAIDFRCEVTGRTQYGILKEEFSELENFVLKETNYSSEFIDENKNFSVLLSKEHSSFKVFAAANKIKSDYKKSNLIIDEIPLNIINFYSKKPAFTNLKDCYLIDLKNAYPTSLLNTGIITNETFQYLNSISKKNKLKAIGSLATKKTIKKYNFGKLVDFKIQPRGEYSVIYFYAAYTVGEIMEKAKEIAGEDFLMYWFDGVYINKNIEKANEIKLFFESINYNSKIVELDFFKCEFLEIEEKMKISWLEKGDEKEKVINLPIDKF